MIRTMIENSNQKMVATNSRSIQLDEASVEYLIQEEEAILKAAEEPTKKAPNGQESAAEEHDNDNAKTSENGEEETSKEEPVEESEVNRRPKEAAGSGSVTETATTNLGARIVYIVPPKQTRRRGIKPGCAYLVISGPTIEAKEPTLVAPTPAEPPTDPSKEEKKEPNDETNGVAEEKETKTEDAADQPEETPASPTEGGGTNHVVIVEPMSSTHSSTTAPAPAVPTVDYSREVAKGRFLVLQAIDLMIAHVQEDSKSDQKYAGSMVEVAMSGKTYKHQFHRRDRREGTLEQTADYKTFIENAAKAKQELMARPKPAPGGGMTNPAGTDTFENGQIVAALVEHIRNKRAEASKRKKAKKKAKDVSSKEKGGGGKSSRKKKGKDGAKEEGGRKGGRKKDGKKGKRTGKKKNVKPAAPTAVLKPGTAGPGAPGPIATPQQPAAAALPGINGGMGGFQGYG
jgi:Smg-4/UPF3 family